MTTNLKVLQHYLTIPVFYNSAEIPDEMVASSFISSFIQNISFDVYESRFQISKKINKMIIQWCQIWNN